MPFGPATGCPWPLRRALQLRFPGSTAQPHRTQTWTPGRGPTQAGCATLRSRKRFKFRRPVPTPRTTTTPPDIRRSRSTEVPTDVVSSHLATRVAQEPISRTEQGTGGQQRTWRRPIQACMLATSAERHKDIDNFIWAFTKTIADSPPLARQARIHGTSLLDSRRLHKTPYNGLPRRLPRGHASLEQTGRYLCYATSRETPGRAGLPNPSSHLGHTNRTERVRAATAQPLGHPKPLPRGLQLRLLGSAEHSRPRSHSVPEVTASPRRAHIRTHVSRPQKAFCFCEKLTLLHLVPIDEAPASSLMLRAVCVLCCSVHE